jgi:hypothetical protein
VVEGLSTEHEDQLFRRYLARETELPAQWTAQAWNSGYALRLTPDELTALTETLDALIRPYVAPVRTDAPAGSEVVHLSLRAFLDPDLAPRP